MPRRKSGRAQHVIVAWISGKVKMHAAESHHLERRFGLRNDLITDSKKHLL